MSKACSSWCAKVTWVLSNLGLLDLQELSPVLFCKSYVADAVKRRYWW